MGTSCDENAAAPEDVRTQQQIDRNNGKPWMSRIALRLKPPDVLSSRFHHYNSFVT
jgi:hypothetical protein